MEIDDFSVDEGLLNEGVKVPMSLSDEEDYLILGSFESTNFRQEFIRLSRPYVRVYGKNIPEKEREEIMCRAMAATILLGWGKSITAKGKALGVYTIEKAYEVLNKFPKFRDRVTVLASDETLFKKDEAKENEKNSETGQNG